MRGCAGAFASERERFHRHHNVQPNEIALQLADPNFCDALHGKGQSPRVLPTRFMDSDWDTAVGHLPGGAVGLRLGQWRRVLNSNTRRRNKCSLWF